MYLKKSYKTAIMKTTHVFGRRFHHPLFTKFFLENLCYGILLGNKYEKLVKKMHLLYKKFYKLIH